MSDNIELFDFLHQSSIGKGTNGYSATLNSSIELFYSHEPHQAQPVMYTPGIVLLLSGFKRGRINTLSLDNDPEKLLVLTTSYPIECEVVASNTDPLRGIYISLEFDRVRKVCDVITKHKPDYFHTVETSKGMASITRTDKTKFIVGKILQNLSDPITSELVIDGLLDQLYLEVICSEIGPMLYDFVQEDSKQTKIASAIEFIHQNHADKITVEEMANVANMSVSAFHRSFKQIITDSPLQYLKKVRLNQAKHYISYIGDSAQISAHKVGYESASQFSRDFKRFYGVPPSQYSLKERR